MYCCKVTYKYGAFLTNTLMVDYRIGFEGIKRNTKVLLWMKWSDIDQNCCSLTLRGVSLTFFCHSLFLQVLADDVLTKEEQIGLLFIAKQKCENIIKAKHNIHGEPNWQCHCCFLFFSWYCAYCTKHDSVGIPILVEIKSLWNKDFCKRVIFFQQ